jgi:hypothetical protein
VNFWAGYASFQDYAIRCIQWLTAKSRAENKLTFCRIVLHM